MRKNILKNIQYMEKIAIILSILFFFACDTSNLGIMAKDVYPPVLQSHKSFPDYFLLTFDEPLSEAEFFQIQPVLPFDSLVINASRLKVRFQEKMNPGRNYLLRASASDSSGNMLNFLIRIYGKNLNPAQLVINELNPEGSKSSNSPEVIEFYAVAAGNIGGLLFCVGTKEENKGSYIFPPVEVSQGDFILLHTRWDPGHKYDIHKVNETTSQVEAKARLSSDQAWDFWAEEISGLSDSNSALTLYESPEGKIMDALVYSTSFTAEKYRGWKSSYLERQVDALGLAGAWLGNSRELVPEDAIRSKDSSGTRSLSRRHQDGMPIDSNRAGDWIIVRNRSYSFGSRNQLIPYSP